MTTAKEQILFNVAKMTALTATLGKNIYSKSNEVGFKDEPTYKIRSKSIFLSRVIMLCTYVCMYIHNMQVH